MPSFKIAANVVQYGFSHPLQMRAEPNNYFSITGKHWFNASVDYSATVKNTHFFGEAAVDKRGNLVFCKVH